MDARRRFQVTNLLLGLVTLGHALATWPRPAVAVLFGGGVAVAFLAELVVVRLGLLEHALTPAIAGVPLSFLVVWPGVIYLSLRTALLFIPPGVGAAVTAAVIATAVDVVTDPVGVGEEVWRYPEHRLSELRFNGVPWWNFVGWFVIAFTTTWPTLLV